MNESSARCPLQLALSSILCVLQAQSRGSRVNFSSNSSVNVYRRVGIEQLCAQQRTGIFFEVGFLYSPHLVFIHLFD